MCTHVTPPKSVMFALTSDVIGGTLWGQQAGESRTVERNRDKDCLQSWELATCDCVYETKTLDVE